MCLLLAAFNFCAKEFVAVSERSIPAFRHQKGRSLGLSASIRRKQPVEPLLLLSYYLRILILFSSFRILDASGRLSSPFGWCCSPVRCSVVCLTPSSARHKISEPMMSFFNNLQILTKIAATLGMLILISMGVSYSSYASLSKLEQTAAMTDHTYKVINALNGITASMVDQETGIRGYLVSADEAFLAPQKAGCCL
ncbi:CHASE3 domain-containing protein [Rhizobium sp. 9140]|nr:CHASE3 domain-containing protein [Rhizobium sp. 9140]